MVRSCLKDWSRPLNVQTRGDQMAEKHEGVEDSIRRHLTYTGDSWDGILHKCKEVVSGAVDFHEWSRADPVLGEFLEDKDKSLPEIWSTSRIDKMGCLHLNMFTDLAGPSKLFGIRSRMILKGRKSPTECSNPELKWVNVDHHIRSRNGEFVLVHGLFYGKNYTYEFYLDFTNAILIWAHRWDAQSHG